MLRGLDVHVDHKAGEQSEDCGESTSKDQWVYYCDAVWRAIPCIFNLGAQISEDVFYLVRDSLFTGIIVILISFAFTQKSYEVLL